MNHELREFNVGKNYVMEDFFFSVNDTLISTEQIDKLKSNPKISFLMYFSIPSDQPKISTNTLQ